MKTREQIKTLLRDGKLRTRIECKEELGRSRDAVDAAFRQLIERGEVIAVAGYAFRPVNGKVQNRYTLAEVRA